MPDQNRDNPSRLQAKDEGAQPSALKIEMPMTADASSGEIAIALENISDAIVVLDHEWRYTYVNRKATQLLKRERQELLGKIVWEEFPEATEQIYDMYHKAVTEQIPLQFKHYYPPLDRWFEQRLFPSSQGLSIFFQDITEREEAGRALRESQQLYEGLFNSIDSIVWECDARTHDFTFISKHAERLLGYPVERWTTERNFWQDHIYPDDREWAISYCQAAIAEKRPHDFEYRMLAADERVVWLRDIVSVILSNGEVVKLRGVMVDITAQKQLEEQLQQSQKMEAIGRLAGGIAHDFNNVLTVIMGQSNLALLRLSEDDPLRQKLERIKVAGERAAALTRQLLAFSRKQMLQPHIVCLNSIVEEIYQLMLGSIGEDLELVLELEPELGMVRADPTQIHQVLMNLAVNARQAMPHGGTLKIKTANAVLDDHIMSKHPYVEQGDYVLLEVSDTGIGMDHQTKRHLFEPFFTTKEVGQGTGLGLSTVYGIVKQSRGYIWVESELERGTMFSIYLPQIKEKPVSGALDNSLVAQQGTETILLVEDDAMVREMTCEILEAHGFNVLKAGDVDTALALCQRYKGHIDLLLTDIVMPKSNGLELAKQLKGLRPHLRTLYMSGYTNNSIAYRGESDEDIAFIQKPFDPEDLIGKIRDVLDAPSMKNEDRG